LTVKTPKGTKVVKATLVGGNETPVIETARNEYNVDVPAKTPDGPFVIKLQIEEATGDTDRYRDALA
ncbi:MAG: alpha-L-fucosidase, partial [Paramuribaculum sp.]|nr:alpha-L-fucosidase [Paramuribaculum sp.]